ncbi:hypothetical protein M426DRAFT_322583 [Hypoxylon sp. CI-4A]|nr:hypothetical protein M426DRAFT_322583 [Hypoxylon sp. CI-4A]
MMYESIRFIILALVVQVILRKLYKAVCSIYFHPLSRFPGPKLWAISNAPYSYWFLGGRQPYKLLDLHRKYGPIVRIAPGELSFNSAQSFKDIYGFRQGHKTFIKSDFYDNGSFASHGVHSIVSERDPGVHGQMRKLLSHAFSASSLGEQEELIAITIDRFVEVVRSRWCDSGSDAGFDIGKAYEMMTFDIIGDLAFGETFQALERTEPHPWIAITLGALTQGALVDTFKRFPILGDIVQVVMPGKLRKLMADTKRNEDMAIGLIKRRIERKTDRKDFMTRILEYRETDRAEATDVELAAHASDFVLAGSETTATALSCITYYLLTTPHARQNLEKEIRDAFTSYDDINDLSTRPLKYLHAVVLEGLRMFPPLPFSLPRVVPKGGDVVDGELLPEGIVVSTSPVAASLDETNFINPFSFKPERWLGMAEDDILDASQPFSLGARGCIGRNLAWLELRTTLAKVLWTFDLELEDPSLDWHRESRMYTLWQKPELQVRAKIRNT